ncbi:MAG TPA: hypothetical protein GX513_08930 [Firmicutes bacterium]|nr:hypothetical protein [Bacillota bacterium]
MAGTGLVIPAGAIAAGEALAPLTCGELVQGTLGGRHFLVSCPIDVYTRAEVSLYRAGPDVSRAAAALLPPLPPGAGAKASRAVQLTLASLGKEDIQARVRLTRFFPPGKGLGTSTADILATAQATAQALGCRLTPSELARIALAIEPSDSTMFPGLALFDHRQGCTACARGSTWPAPGSCCPPTGHRLWLLSPRSLLSG